MLCRERVSDVIVRVLCERTWNMLVELGEGS